MFVSISKERFLDARHRFYEWRYELDFARKVMLALFFACLTGLGTFIRFYVPFSPVPFTAQVFFVLLSGMVLGHIWGGVCQSLYVGLAMLGVPWTTAGGGVDVVFGYTGGYLLGFIVAALLVGYLTDSDQKHRQLRYQMPIMVLGVLVIYILGVSVLTASLSMPLFGWSGAIWLGAGVFLLVDTIKLALAGAAGKMLLTKQPFGHTK
jgi:biotin transport system substrate-specific component